MDEAYHSGETADLVKTSSPEDRLHARVKSEGLAPERDKPLIEDNGNGGSPQNDKARQKRGGTVKLVGFLVVAALALGGGYYWFTSRNLESTDDAFTDGRAISVAPRVAGQVVALDVTDNQFVRKGDPLIHIDPSQFTVSRDSAQGNLDMAKAQFAGEQYGAEIARKNYPAVLQQSQAQLAVAQANLFRATADNKRQKSLPKQATTQQEVDAAEAAYRQAEAQVQLAQAQVFQNSPVPQRIGVADSTVGQLKGQVEQAQAQLDQANLNLDWTVVRAPQDGWITKRNVEVGTYVSPGQQIFSIVSPEVWVTANFKENQLDRMRAGQPVKIEVDAYPHLDLHGHVDSIQLGSGSKFTAFPPENATGNYVKIVQRVPVKILIDKGLDPEQPLPLGLSVVPTVTLK
ncbi:HlyD family secretion protein [Beijerinckia indica]|uniref:Secretion protein HlyD family protein n=1 Tax=Beijerinckia indica subsp. indica (strain ATCC 9039 / DSM 1715 / NCIMB 8712) TaxID=395963 RepID=B2IF83_BEII9|nr:HlyD family secretion protein [Beijerinckia indica]ACB95648.1 secretion protein HlyD family protein [Beijerinckia indica subsp. indica ATCC 9039]